MKTKILQIRKLQEEARTLQAKSYRLLEEADILAKEVKASGGNRDWLLLDTDVKVI